MRCYQHASDGTLAVRSHSITLRQLSGAEYHSQAQLLGYLDREETHESLVLDFLDHVETTRGCSARTRNARLAAIRALFGFIARQQPSLLLHCQRIRTIPLKRTQHKTVGYLEEDEMQALLNAVELSSRTAHHPAHHRHASAAGR
jgi:site-specific recombinase XerD